MTPRQNSSGGKERLGRTSKRGDKYIRSLLTAGAVAVLRHARNRPTRDGEWVRALVARKPTKLAAVALANKTARIVWAVMMRGTAAQGIFLKSTTGGTSGEIVHYVDSNGVTIFALLPDGSLLLRPLAAPPTGTKAGLKLCNVGGTLGVVNSAGIFTPLT